MQLRVRHIARNVFSNWLATVANMVVGFFLAPFIVHHLGNEAYGIWVLAISSISYLGMLDLGMRSSVLRFISKGRTVGDHEGSSAALSGALWVRLQISVVVLILASILAYAFPIMFKLPHDLARDARIAVMIIGLNMAIYMSMGVFGGVLSGINRYDMQTFVVLVQIAIRVSGVVLVLRHGHGIVAIAGCEFLATLVGNVMMVTLARRLYPELRVRLRRPDSQVLRALWSYSMYAFLTTVAMQLVYQTDNLVVGGFITAGAVTLYSIGSSLSRYTDQLTSAMTLSFVPAASTFEASGDAERLQGLYKIGTRAVMAVSLPVVVTWLIRGRNFIGLWMGPQYSQRSGTVLIILATALIFSQANTTALAIAFGTDKHKTTAKWSLGEGVTNLVLSMLLVRPFGIYGVAIGTLIPSLVVNLVLWPRYIGKTIEMRSWEVIVKIWGPMLLCAVPFALVSYLVNLRFQPHNLVMFLIQTVMMLPVFYAAVSVVFRQEVRLRVLPAVRAFLHTKTNLFAQG